MQHNIKISDYNYTLPEERIAKFPLENRADSKLLRYTNGKIEEDRFSNIGKVLPAGSMLVFNNTKVIRARLIFHKESGARIEIFCLEPHLPADYERAFSVHDECQWSCIVGNLKKWKEGALNINFDHNGTRYRLSARRVESNGKDQIIAFEWDCPLTFGQLLEELGRIPIPPYLCRESELSDNTRYQTVYSKFEGSVAAPTAGLHFTSQIIKQLQSSGHPIEEVTLHVGAGTFLPVKGDDVSEHKMHTEHFTISLSSLQNLIKNIGNIVAVGTTSVRTLESVVALGYRVIKAGDPQEEKPIGQWEIYEPAQSCSPLERLQALEAYMQRRSLEKLTAATQIMIAPPYKFALVDGIITNFHQPQSTLLLLVSAFIGADWKKVYDFALSNDFRFLSYGDSSVLLRK